MGNKTDMLPFPCGVYKSPCAIYFCAPGPRGTGAIRGDGADVGKRNRCGKKLQRVRRKKKILKQGHRREKARGFLWEKIGNKEASQDKPGKGAFGAHPSPCNASREQLAALGA